MSKPTDTNEPSPASAGSRPVAWAADIPGKFGAAPTLLFGYTEKLVKGIAAAGGDLVQPFPLYRSPQTCPHVVGHTTLHCSLTPLTLTDEERRVLRELRDSYAAEDDQECKQIADVLDGLLKRTRHDA
jgi:hypothetical protein